MTFSLLLFVCICFVFYVVNFLKRLSCSFCSFFSVLFLACPVFLSCVSDLVLSVSFNVVLGEEEGGGGSLKVVSWHVFPLVVSSCYWLSCCVLLKCYCVVGFLFKSCWFCLPSCCLVLSFIVFVFSCICIVLLFSFFWSSLYLSLFLVVEIHVLSSFYVMCYVVLFCVVFSSILIVCYSIICCSMLFYFILFYFICFSSYVLSSIILSPHRPLIH